MSAVVDVVLAPVRRFLLDEAATMLGGWRQKTVGTDGRAHLLSAMATWKANTAGRRSERVKAKSAISTFSPEGRMLGKGFRAWHEFAKERAEHMGRVKNALVRLSPEGRAKNAGLQAFKARTPRWTPWMRRFARSGGRRRRRGTWGSVIARTTARVSDTRRARERA